MSDKLSLAEESRQRREVRRKRNLWKAFGTHPDHINYKNQVEVMNIESGGIWLWGDSGVGKSHCAYHLCRNRNYLSHEVVGYKWYDLEKLFVNKFTNDWSFDQTLLEETSVLLIDDLDKLKLTESTEKELCAMFDMAMERKMIAVITANQNIEEFVNRFKFNEYAPAVYRRLKELCKKEVRISING